MNQGIVKKILIAIVILIIIAIVMLAIKNLAKDRNLPNLPAASPSITPVSQTDKPQIVSTKPNPLNDNIISGSDPIEITFNRPLENVGEFKVRIEPKIEYKVELSGDRKTAKIVPAKPYPLGTAFTLTINPDSKFDGVGSWGETKDFHFRTIKYTGV